MANAIVAVQSLSRNDISILAQLFEISFDYHIEQNTPFYPDYLRSLRTLIGLGFTAVLADSSLVCVYQRYLDYFMAEKEGDFKNHRHAKTLLAQSSAEMVGNAVICFSALRCPPYYQDFLTALNDSIGKIARFTEHHSEAERILNHLSVK